MTRRTHWLASSEGWATNAAGVSHRDVSGSKKLPRLLTYWHKPCDSVALSRFGTGGMANTGWTWVTEQKLPSSIDAGHHFIAEVLARLEDERWTSQEIFGVHLALEEAVVNAIKHGNRLDLQKRVHISCKMDPDRFWISIADEGEGFDPNAVPDCTDDEHIHIPSGRGLLLMRCYMNQVEYNDRGNVVTMEKVRKQSG
jgi:serine/threonine-protein kinase RsbW